MRACSQILCASRNSHEIEINWEDCDSIVNTHWRGGFFPLEFFCSFSFNTVAPCLVNSPSQIELHLTQCSKFTSTHGRPHSLKHNEQIKILSARKVWASKRESCIVQMIRSLAGKTWQIYCATLRTDAVFRASVIKHSMIPRARDTNTRAVSQVERFATEHQRLTLNESEHKWSANTTDINRLRSVWDEWCVDWVKAGAYVFVISSTFGGRMWLYLYVCVCVNGERGSSGNAVE